MFRALLLQALRSCLLLLLGIGRLAAAWSVTSGQCKLDADGCISSTNHPSDYPRDDACTIQVSEANIRPIQAVTFMVDIADNLWVNGRSYNGYGIGKSPDGVVPRGTIDWRADSRSTWWWDYGEHWKICLRQPQEPQEVQFVLDGHCDSRVNGRYDLQGLDANGRPMYALEETYFLYYSTDCDGELHAWTISYSGYSCAVRRAYVEDNTELPPQSATWSILCYEPTKWTETTLTLSEETSTMTTTTTMTVTMTTTTRVRPANMSEYLVVQRSCRSWLSGVYELQGWSSSGLTRPWYKYENSILSSAVYLWYDEQCGAAWYFKSTSPNDNSSNDPGGADSCNFYSRADSEAILPPASGWQTWCTDSQIDLYPDQASIAATAWFVSSGSCEFLPDSQCITTTGFPLGFYGSYDHCSIEVAENSTLPIQVLAFETGSKDSLMVNGQSYSGTHGPDDVVPQGIVEWRADRVDAAGGHAWAICLGEVPANMAEVNGRPWRVIAGYCKVDDAGCITNRNYPNSDDADAVCGIFVDESDTRRLVWGKRPELVFLNGEEINQTDFDFWAGPVVPRGSVILLRGGSSYDSFKICLEDWMVEQWWFWATVSSVIGSFFCCPFGFYWLRRKFRLKAARKLQEKHGECYKQWYAHYRHAMYSIIQSSFDERAPGVKMLILTEPTKLDVEHGYLFQAARKLQEDMGEAFKSKKHPFYVDGKLVLDYKSITFASQIPLNSLGKEISKHTADRRAVIIAACDVKEVLKVKTVVREHNSNKERHGSHGRAKFAFMPLFKDLPQREGKGVKRFAWYSFYRFSVMAKMQIAVDEGATGLKLLGIQPNVGNDMTVLEYPALEEDLNEAREKREYPFIAVDDEKLLLDTEEFTMERVRLEDFRQKDGAYSYLDQNTNDKNAVIIVSATDADGKEAAEVVKEFHKRHRGTRQVMRAWATAGDEYHDSGGDHGSKSPTPTHGMAKEGAGKATTSEQDFTNILVEEKPLEGSNCQLESLESGFAPGAPKRGVAVNCCVPGKSEDDLEILESDFRDGNKGEATVYCGNLLCGPPREKGGEA